MGASKERSLGETVWCAFSKRRTRHPYKWSNSRRRSACRRKSEMCIGLLRWKNYESLKIAHLRIEFSEMIHVDFKGTLIAWFQPSYRLAIRTEGMIEDLVRNLRSENQELQMHCASAIFKVRSALELGVQYSKAYTGLFWGFLIRMHNYRGLRGSAQKRKPLKPTQPRFIPVSCA